MDTLCLRISETTKKGPLRGSYCKPDCNAPREPSLTKHVIRHAGMAHYSLASNQDPHETNAAPGLGAILQSSSLGAIVIHSTLQDFHLGATLFRSLTVDTSRTTGAWVCTYVTGAWMPGFPYCQHKDEGHMIGGIGFERQKGPLDWPSRADGLPR